ncbi:E3 ubiquitin-protein ligase-like [Cebidichthys violaceus]|uniref:E3 ubiquitin-protein ligase-like n=1 Tax=Cebidichthys violaceus TaxID=271503 RepID=UPI0035CB5E82
MFSEHECGICYQTYNAGRRCPRELHCKHSFCESCLLLLALSRPLGPDGADRLIVCPLCRHTTSISGEGRVRAELRVDERVLERLLVSGVLDKEEEEEEKEEEDPVGHVQDGCDDTEEPTLPETPAEESDSSTGSRGGRLRRSCRKVWRLVSGKDSRQRGGGNCMTNDDFRSFAMMASYMF